MNGTPSGTPNPVMRYGALPAATERLLPGRWLELLRLQGFHLHPAESVTSASCASTTISRKNWHFNATYHYYKLSNTVDNQIDVGGFFPGDTMGQYAAIRQKPQEPWIYTAGLTTNVSSNVTNDFHYSFTRN